MMSLDGESKAPVEDEKSDEKCEKCGMLMVEKGSKLVCVNEDCKNVREKK